MARTYLPTLLFLLQKVCEYITRYQDTIREYLDTDEKKAALDAVKLACDTFTVLVVIPKGD